MSGGHFNYDQHRLGDHAEEILKEINNNYKEYDWEKDEWIERENWETHKPETIYEFIQGYLAIKKAQIYLQRIDWYLSGDDGEESFHRRLKEDMSELENEIKNTYFNNDIEVDFETIVNIEETE